MSFIRRGLRPGLKPGLDLPDDTVRYRRELPFRRSWVAIALLAAMDIALLIPAVFSFRQGVGEWGQMDDLFDLVGALFLTAWLLGWSIGPLLMTTVLALLVFGREVIKVRAGEVEVFIGLPLVGVRALYRAKGMRNLRIEYARKQSGDSWRGTHFAFDYGANTVAFGSAVDDAGLTELKSGIHMGAGVAVGRGKARKEDLQTPWEGRDPMTVLAGTSADPAPQATAPPALSLNSPSVLLLILANLVPLAGAAFLGWELSHVMVLYWAESAIVGFFNICKMVVIGRWWALLAGPFFAGHFGGFMAVHFLFIYVLFVRGVSDMDASAGDLGEVAALFVNLWPALLALLASHGFSFYSNFLRRGEYRGRTIMDQMSEPYSRIMFMHLVLIFGGGLTLFLQNPTPVLVVVIGLKVYFDIKAHRKERLRG